MFSSDTNVKFEDKKNTNQLDNQTNTVLNNRSNVEENDNDNYSLCPFKHAYKSHTLKHF